MMDSAVEALRQLLEQGYEWPDATWRITQRYGVDLDELTLVYDQEFS